MKVARNSADGGPVAALARPHKWELDLTFRCVCPVGMEGASHPRDLGV